MKSIKINKFKTCGSLADILLVDYGNDIAGIIGILVSQIENNSNNYFRKFLFYFNKLYN